MKKLLYKIRIDANGCKDGEYRAGKKKLSTVF